MKGSGLLTSLGTMFLDGASASPRLSVILDNTPQFFDGSALAAFRDYAKRTRQAWNVVLADQPVPSMLIGWALKNANGEWRDAFAKYARDAQLTLGRQAILAEAAEGLSFFLTKENYETFIANGGSSFLGRSRDTGSGIFYEQFAFPLVDAEKIIARAGTSTDEYGRLIGVRYPVGTDRLYKVDLPPLDFSWMPDIPSGFEVGANDQFRFGATTPGGAFEIRLRNVPRATIVRVLEISGLDPASVPPTGNAPVIVPVPVP
jgi:hypothetical protein